MAVELKPEKSDRSTEVPDEDVVTLRQLSDENTKPADTPHSTDPHLSPWPPLRTKLNGTSEPTQSSTHPNDKLKRSIESESGTEADDEHFLLGVPASRSKQQQQKGLKELERTISGTTTKGLSDEQDGIQAPRSARGAKLLVARTIMAEFSRKRRIELLRRVSEVGLLFGLGCIVYSGDGQKGARLWETGMPHRLALSVGTDVRRIGVGSSHNRLFNGSLPNTAAILSCLS